MADSITGGLTYGAVKADLATVVDNGSCSDYPQVLARTNQATQILLHELIPVGGMATYDVEADGTILLLPTALENAIEVEVRDGATVNGGTDVTQGWYDIVSNFTYVDPSTAHDNPLVDQGLVPSPGDVTVLCRQYDYPGLQPNATVRVTGAKRFIPIEDDDTYLIIQNVPALKLAIMYLELSERGTAFDEAKKYKEEAIALLQAEVRQHLLDPRNSTKRKAAYQADLTAYPEGTLGRTRAKLALELPGMLLKGKAEIGYLVNRAVQMLVDNRNQLALIGKLAVHEGTGELGYTQPIDASSALSWTDYNQIRLMVHSFMLEEKPETAPVAQEYQKRAFELQQAQLIERMEFRRRTTYETVLASTGPKTMGYLVARLALDIPDGLKMTNTELTRVANSAEHRLMDRGRWKNTVTDFSAIVNGGYVLFPLDVESILAASMDGTPLTIRGRYFEFHENGPGYLDPCCDSGCLNLLVDQGEVLWAATGQVRRKYKVLAGSSDGATLRVIAKRRWMAKAASDILVIQNYEALRLMVLSILNQANIEVSAALASQAFDVLTRELQEFLSGIKPHVEVQVRGHRRVRMLR